MKIEITRVTSWTDVLNAARFTQRLPLKSGEPSVKWKKKIIFNKWKKKKMRLKI